MGEHRAVGTVDLLGRGSHPPGRVPVQVGLNAVVLGGHDESARLRPPRGSWRLLIEQFRGRRRCRRPHKLLLLVRQISAEVPDAGREHPDPTVGDIQPAGKMAVVGYLACWLAAVSSSSGATAAMYTSPTTRSSVPAAVITAPT